RDRSEADLQRRAVTQAGAALQPDEVLVVDAGFGVAALLTAGGPRFVARVARNFTARRNVLPAYKGRGRFHRLGGAGPPLPRTPERKAAGRPPPRGYGAMGGGWAVHPRAGREQRGPLHGQAGSCGVPVCGDPRPALPGTLGVGAQPAG